jgi:hypothetical protein
MTQTELAERWQISEAALERWRTEAGGPVFLKLGAQVRYRVHDVEAFEAEVLRESTKSDGVVVQHEIVNQPKCQLKNHNAPDMTNHHLVACRSSPHPFRETAPPKSAPIATPKTPIFGTSKKLIKKLTANAKTDEYITRAERPAQPDSDCNEKIGIAADVPPRRGNQIRHSW